MPKTLLAVDDSATMRKALEITFSGEDYRVVAADSPATAVAKLGEGPSVVIIDTVLGGADGYALCKDVRSKLPKAAIILLSSRYNPYDAGKGQDAGADDFCDKPFDTQQLIDKAKKPLFDVLSLYGIIAVHFPVLFISFFGGCQVGYHHAQCRSECTYGS